jgi:hypothetical protein
MAGMIDIPGQAPAEPEAGAPPAGGGFQRPDISSAIPPEQQDAVARIVAAGMKVMYAPEMREQILEVVQSQEPVSKKLAESVVGLLLVMDQKKPLPIEALPWAAVELLGEAAEILQAAKQPVSDEDFKAASTGAVWLIARKMGASDDEVINGLDQAGQGAQPTAAPMP